MIREPVRRLGAAVLAGVAETGRLSHLLSQAGRHALIGPFQGRRIPLRPVMEQLRRAGTDSLALVALISVLVGMILALQSAYQLRELGATDLVPGLVAVSVVRELAPLLTAILVAGRVGSAIAAEIGTMRVSQEIDALTVMGIDPVAFLVVPRLVGLLIAVPCLTLFADLVGMLGGAGVGVLLLGLGPSSYLADSLAALTLQDLWGGVLKAWLFGGILAAVSCHQGLETTGGAEAGGTLHHGGGGALHRLDYRGRSLRHRLAVHTSMRHFPIKRLLENPLLQSNASPMGEPAKRNSGVTCKKPRFFAPRGAGTAPLERRRWLLKRSSRLFQQPPQASAKTGRWDLRKPRRHL